MALQHIGSYQRGARIAHSTYSSCSGYRSFLADAKAKVLPETPNMLQHDFARLPITHKANYTSVYDITHRILGSDISGFEMYTTSSGSTGLPVLWPRSQKFDRLSQKFLHKNLDILYNTAQKKTLVVILFPLGMSTAGTELTQKILAMSASRSITVITPGEQYDTGAQAIEDLYKQYEQTILVGYPKYIDDLISYAKQKNTTQPSHWRAHVVYAGDITTSYWRKNITSALRSSTHTPHIHAIYGSAETGVIGIETSLCQDLYWAIAQNPSIQYQLFDAHIVPTLVEVDAQQYLLELHGTDILITANQPAPLVRYAIGDEAIILPSDVIRDILTQHSTKPHIQSIKNIPKVLAILGRKNPPNTFRLIELKHILEPCLLSQDLHPTVFQYTQSVRNSILYLHLTLYSASETYSFYNVLKNRLNTQLTQELNKKNPSMSLQLELNIKHISQQPITSAGKIRYQTI